jgi:hypothetical protein
VVKEELSLFVVTGNETVDLRWEEVYLSGKIKRASPAFQSGGGDTTSHMKT